MLEEQKQTKAEMGLPAYVLMQLIYSRMVLISSLLAAGYVMSQVAMPVIVHQARNNLVARQPIITKKNPSSSHGKCNCSLPSRQAALKIPAALTEQQV